MKKIKILPFPVSFYLKIIDEIQSPFAGLTRYCQDEGIIIVELPKTASLETIVHESMHVIQYLAKFVETTFDDETQAYLLEFVFNEISKHLE